MRAAILLSFLALTHSGAASAATYVVNPQGTGDFPTIQAAVDSVLPGDTIELTDGTFMGDGNRDVTYRGKAITVRSQSGAPEDCIINCEGGPASPHRGVLFNTSEGPGSVLDGVSISGGYSSDRGGAIYCLNLASPTLRNCRFVENESYNYGGALAIGDYSNPHIEDCVFERNLSYFGGAAYCQYNTCTFDRCLFKANEVESGGEGGALNILGGAGVQLVDCVFTGNRAMEGGGAELAGRATLTRCSFIGNVAQTDGGGIDAYSPPTCIDCLFEDNSAYRGGGVAVWDRDSEFSDCVFTGNVAMQGGGLLGYRGSVHSVRNCTFVANTGYGYGGGIFLQNAYLDASNTIVSFSTIGRAIYCSSSTATLTCCDLYGNEGGDWVGYVGGQYGINGNICEDPLFCDATLGNYRIEEFSPCAPFTPPNPECDLIGALPAGCNLAAVDESPGSARLSLGACRPNPFSQVVELTYELPASRDRFPVRLQVVDLAGRLVRTLVDARQAQGPHAIRWDGTDQQGRPVSEGVYFCTLSCEGASLARRVLLIR